MALSWPPFQIAFTTYSLALSIPFIILAIICIILLIIDSINLIKKNNKKKKKRICCYWFNLKTISQIVVLIASIGKLSFKIFFF